MFSHILKISNRTLIVTLEVLAVIALLVSILFAGFVWKLSQGPISVGFAKDYVEEALSGMEENMAVTFDDIVLSWPELRGPLMLDLTGLRVQQGEGDANSLTIDSASVGLSRRALLWGRIRPVSVIVKNPSLELVRDTDGKLSLFLQAKKEAPAQPAEQAEKPKTKPGQEVANLFRDMATNKRGSLIARLREFAILDASVAIRDYEYGLSWYLNDLNFIIKEDRNGVTSSLAMTLPGGSKETANIAVNMEYRKETDDFRMAGRIQDINPYIISRFLPVPDEMSGQDLYFSGEVEGDLDANLKPKSFRLSGSIPEGKISIPEEYDEVIAVKDIQVTSEYSAADKILNISNLSGDIGGVVFSGSAKALFADKTVTMPVELKIEKAELAQIPPLFPKSEHDGEAYVWLARDIQGGTFSDVVMDMELTADRVKNEETQEDGWVFDMPQFNLDFAFEGAKVTYNNTLMPAENARGRGKLDLAAETLEIVDGSATIGDIDGTDVTVKVTDLMKAGAGYVTINVKTKGPVATALNYIAAEPIGMGEEEIGLDAKAVKGTIDAQVDIGLPTLKDVPKDDVKVDIQGTLSDLNVPNVVEGLPLTGGPLALKTEAGGFTIKGPAQLAGRDITLDWHQYFESKGHPYSMKIAASIGADQELRNRFGIDLDDYISGTMPVDIVYIDKGDGSETVDVKGDLNPVRIHIDPFKFEKPVGMPGTITLNAALRDSVLKKLSNIEVKSKEFSVSGGTINFQPLNGKNAEIYSGSLPNAVIGGTQAAVTLDTEKSGALRIDAKAPVFDLGPFLADTDATPSAAEIEAPKEKQRAMKISLSADRMPAQNQQEAKAAKAYLELDTDGDITQMEYDASIGKGNIFVRFKPDDAGKRTFRLETNDAGRALYTFGVYENIHGGTLRIYGEPKSGDLRGDLHGTMQMENFRVIKAPALASLLSLMSLTGVTQLLTNEGLVFSKLESEFEWRFRPQGNLLVIKDGTTSGSSIGLTFSGTIDRGKKTTDIAGTIIPMTEINSILSKIPLVGEILGGSSGLFAATYSMKGPTNNPQVMVNPLSVLAPGIIRRILFEGGYGTKIPEDSAPAAPKKSTPPPAKKSGASAPNASAKPTNTINPAPRTVQPKAAN